MTSPDENQAAKEATEVELHEVDITKKRYEIERLYGSTRGLHFCFELDLEAQAAYDDFTAGGATCFILEGNQLIDTRLKLKEASAEPDSLETNNQGS